ncbi:hypothetical protein F5X98DRAFT_366208 [Xylaria grammica]|nr:hypothetical protein F5X98DRAFT_366208 [Xylaria grammica]
MPSLLRVEPGSRLGIRPSSTESFRYPSSSAHRSHRRQQSLPSLRKASLIAPPTLVPIPSNALEWKNTIDEVKRKYFARNYRSCSVQCCEILVNLRDTSAIEPLHLIYLHFYAASSFEWCARALSTWSTYRAELLCSAQAHYTEAEVLIVAEEWKVAEKAKSLSWASTTSLSSPGFSAASRTPESNSTLSSPRTSIFFLDDEASAKPARLIRVKSKKKVSFSSLPEFFEFQPEPHIRPDSPTLGWDEHALILPHEVEAPFPMLPKKQSPTSIIKSPIEEKTSPEYSRERSSTPSNHTFDLESFLHTRTLNRFREQLLALRGQVCHHRAAVDELLTTPNDTQTTTKTTKPTSELDIPATPTSTLPSPLSARCDEENLRDRIERLRASGWQRKRFDGRRYEALREQVLGELQLCC